MTHLLAQFIVIGKRQEVKLNARSLAQVVAESDEFVFDIGSPRPSGLGPYTTP
jgi:hypothetical protein